MTYMNPLHLHIEPHQCCISESVKHDGKRLAYVLNSPRPLVKQYNEWPSHFTSGASCCVFCHTGCLATCGFPIMHLSLYALNVRTAAPASTGAVRALLRPPPRSPISPQPSQNLSLWDRIHCVARKKMTSPHASRSYVLTFGPSRPPTHIFPICQVGTGCEKWQWSHRAHC